MGNNSLRPHLIAFLSVEVLKPMVFDDGTHCLGPEYFNHVGRPTFISHFLPFQFQGKKAKQGRRFPLCISPSPKLLVSFVLNGLTRIIKTCLKPPKQAMILSHLGSIRWAVEFLLVSWQCSFFSPFIFNMTYPPSMTCFNKSCVDFYLLLQWNQI